MAVVLLGGVASARPTTLPSLIAEVRQRSPTIAAARARIRAARAVSEAAGWPDDPMLTVEGDELPGSHQGDEGPMVRYMLEQPLPVPGALGLEQRVSELAAERAVHDLETAWRDQELLATRAFLMLRMVDGGIAVNDSQRALVEDVIDSALGRMRSGADTHHDVIQSQVELLSLQSERTTLDAERTAATAMINALRDRPAASDIEPAEVGPLPDSVPPSGRLEDFAVRHRSELRSMRTMAREDRAMAELMRREAWPMLRIGGWYNQELQMPDSFGISLGGTIPIFGVPRQSARAAAAERRAEATDAERSGMRAMVRSRVRAARARYLATVQRQALVRDVAIPRAEEALAAAQSSYRAGMMPFASLIQDRRMLAELRMDLIRAEVDRATAFAELLRELGADSLNEVGP